MLLESVNTSFLHAYNAIAGSWASYPIGDPGVSPLIRAAMNLILLEDGILAYIGTRSEFGLYETKLFGDNGTENLHCWISLPASTILQKLGLCQNMQTSGRPGMVFAGNPLVISIACLIYRPELDVAEIRREGHNLYLISTRTARDLELAEPVMLELNDLELAELYLRGTKFGVIEDELFGNIEVSDLDETGQLVSQM